MTLAKIPEPKQAVFCSVCGELLTSTRSIRYGKGQRCRWKTEGKVRRRTSTVGQGMPISDVEFTESGGKGYQRKQYEVLE